MLKKLSVSDGAAFASIFIAVVLLICMGVDAYRASECEKKSCQHGSAVSIARECVCLERPR